MSLPFQIALQVRIDGYSYQVSSSTDQRFWFRLIREQDRDIITDYFLGSFPWKYNGAILAECYKALGLTPRLTLEFRDVLSSMAASEPTALKEAMQLYKSAGDSLLAEFGLQPIDHQTEESRGKISLVIFGSEI
jgi:hypothetical protein